MKFAFQKMTLETDSFYSIISTWAEMQLRVSLDAAVIVGFGFDPEVARGFTLLVPDWEATVVLPEDGIDLEPGNYDLILDGEDLYACRYQRKFLLTDGPAVVEVVAVAE